MIGATTENPFFSDTRYPQPGSVLFELEPQQRRHSTAIQLALTDKERGFDFPVELDKEALDFIAISTNGDLRPPITR